MLRAQKPTLAFGKCRKNTRHFTKPWALAAIKWYIELLSAGEKTEKSKKGSTILC
jgi:hypothetical protein